MNGKGGERGPDIVTDLEIVKLSDGQLLTILRDGKPQAGMPGFSGLDPGKTCGSSGLLADPTVQRSTPAVAVMSEMAKNCSLAKVGVRNAIWFMAPEDL